MYRQCCGKLLVEPAEGVEPSTLQVTALRSYHTAGLRADLLIIAILTHTKITFPNIPLQNAVL